MTNKVIPKIGGIAKNSENSSQQDMDAPKRKRGRPVTKGGKDPVRSIRVPDEQWEHWQQVAEGREISISQLIRQSVDRALRDQGKARAKQRSKNEPKAD